MNIYIWSIKTCPQCQKHTMRTPLSYTCNGIQPADKPIEHLIKSDKISFPSSFVSVLSVMAYNQQISQ